MKFIIFMLGVVENWKCFCLYLFYLYLFIVYKSPLTQILNVNYIFNMIFTTFLFLFFAYIDIM